MKEGRTLRGFLYELVIVVLGVLIALGFGEVADGLRWNQAVGLGRESLRAEIAFDDGYFRDRLTMAPCVDARIATVQGLIEEAGRTHTLGKISGAGLLIGRRLEDSEWQAERASGVLTHFPRKELSTLGRYYVQLDGLRQWIVDENSAWIGLKVLENGPKHFSDMDVALMRRDLETARRTEYMITLNADRQLRFARELGVAEPKADPAWVKRACPAFSRQN